MRAGEAEAAAILGGPVEGSHLAAASARTMTWRRTNGTRPMLRVEVRHAGPGRPLPPAAWPVPGVADGYLLGQRATLTVAPFTAVISTHGNAPAGADARLAGLLLVLEARLRQPGGTP